MAFFFNPVVNWQVPESIIIPNTKDKIPVDGDMGLYPGKTLVRFSAPNIHKITTMKPVNAAIPPENRDYKTENPGLTEGYLAFHYVA
jgi:hypothetical protein